jgi:hypothetical protein
MGWEIMETSNANGSNIIPFTIFLKRIGRSPTSKWRYRRDKLIETINICGRLYVTTEAIARFEQRAIAGEFPKVISPGNLKF